LNKVPVSAISIFSYLFSVDFSSEPAFWNDAFLVSLAGSSSSAPSLLLIVFDDASLPGASWRNLSFISIW
jgi:hypothetical protein